MDGSSSATSGLDNFETFRATRVGEAMAGANLIAMRLCPHHNLRSLVCQLGGKRRPPGRREVLVRLKGVGAVKHVAVRRGINADCGTVRESGALLAVIARQTSLVFVVIVGARGLVKVVVVFCRLLVAMGMVTVDDVGGHELVDDSRDNLDANHTAEEAGDEDPCSSLRRVAALLEGVLGGGQHAIQRREQLKNCSAWHDVR